MSIRAGLRSMARSGIFLPFFRRSHTIIGSVAGEQTDYQVKVELDIFSAYPANAGAAQSTPTSDASGQTVHPSVLFFPDGWNGYKYWMAMTPFTDQDDDVETPEILACDDGVNWVVPAGLTNPIVARDAAAPNSDTCLFYNEATDELWCYYRKTDLATYDKIYLKKSADGIAWGGTGQGILVLTMSLAEALSPTVVKVGATYHMWYVNSLDSPNTINHRTSMDGENWGAEESTNLYGGMPSGWMPWHLEVRWISERSEYWMSLTLTNSDVNWGTGNQLMFARSIDGINWYLHPIIILSPSAAGWDSSRIYQSTFILDGSTLKIWYSGCDAAPDWFTGYTTATLDLDFLDMLRKMRTDGGDLRFTEDDGVTKLDYWVETFSWGNYAAVWVEVSIIPAAPDSATIYVYYGNASETSESSGDDTFPFFDDFEDEAIDDPPDAAKWTTAGTGGPDWILVKADPVDPTNKVLGIHESGDAVNTEVTTIQFADIGGVAIGIKYYRSGNRVAANNYMEGRALDATPAPIFVPYTYDLGAVIGRQHYHNGFAAVDYAPTVDLSVTTWYTLEYRLHALSAILAIDQFGIDVPLLYTGGYFAAYANIRYFRPQRYEWLETNRTRYLDNVYVRKLVDPEPTHGAWGVARRTRWPF